MKYARLAEEILSRGFARVRFDEPERATLIALREKSAEFFQLGEDTKRRYGSADFNFGFRPYGKQFSVTPDRLDMCESFAYWSDDPALIPHCDEIKQFAGALRAYRATVGELTTTILNGFAAHYDYPAVLNFGPASYLEINWYRYSGDRDLLQDRHEDGHLLSYVAPDSPGLEIEVDGKMQAVSFDDCDLLIMPGSLLTVMTGGAVAPMYHQVRNYHLERRSTVLYFVNTPLQGSLPPYAVTDENRGADMVAVAREKCTLYGKSEPPRLLV